MRKISKKRLIMYIFVVAYCIIIIYPLVWVFSNSLKTEKEMLSEPFSLPSDPDWANYSEAWERGNLGTCIGNSAIVSLVSIVVMIAIAPLAAYSLARFEFLGRKFFFLLFLGGMIVPQMVLLLPLLTILKTVHLVDTYFALILPYVAFTLPLSILILRSFFVGMPRSLEDSAKIDGLSSFQVYWKIMFPLVIPALIAAVLLQFIFVWNEFLYALVFTKSPEIFTVQKGLMIFKGGYRLMWGPLNAGVIAVAIPPIALYIFLAKRIKKGMVVGLGTKA